MKTLIFTSLILFTPISNLQVNTKTNESKQINWTREAFPIDFFGDYSYDEHWIDYLNGEIFYEEPMNSGGYDYYPEYIGEGITTFKNYTKEFNQAIISGYNPHYKSRYIEEVNENPNGFIILDEDWKIVNFSSYIEDWVIWNWNEVLDKDNDDSSQTATNDFIDTSVDGGFFSSIEELEEEEYNSTLKDSKITTIGIRNQYYLNFEENPNFLWEGSGAKSYNTYPLEEKLLPPTNKDSISDRDINYDHYHEWIQNNLDQGSTITEYSYWFESNIINELNKDFIEKYGYDELGHDYEQGFHQIEDIRRENLEISYYELNNEEWIEINDYELEFSNFKEVKTIVKTNDNNIFFNENEEIYFNIDVEEELIPASVIEKPSNKNPSNNWLAPVAIYSSISLVLLIILGISWLFIKKKGN